MVWTLNLLMEPGNSQFIDDFDCENDAVDFISKNFDFLKDMNIEMIPNNIGLNNDTSYES